MKKYVKPTVEFVELRPEERLAGSGNCRATQGRSDPLCSHEIVTGIHGNGM